MFFFTSKHCPEYSNSLRNHVGTGQCCRQGSRSHQTGFRSRFRRVHTFCPCVSHLLAQRVGLFHWTRAAGQGLCPLAHKNPSGKRWLSCYVNKEEWLEPRLPVRIKIHEIEALMKFSITFCKLSCMIALRDHMSSYYKNTTLLKNLAFQIWYIFFCNV